MRLTEEQYAALQGRNVPRAAKAPKFGNVPVKRDGEKFDSKLESRRAQDLQLMEKAGEIRDLRFHVSFPLLVADEMIGSYEADAVYFDTRLNRKVVEDSKGVRTPLFRWKARHFKAQFGYAITEVTA